MELRRFLVAWLQHQTEKYLHPLATQYSVISGQHVLQEEISTKLIRLAALQPSVQLRANDSISQRDEVINNAFTLLELAAKQQADLALLPERFPFRGVKANQRQLIEWAQEKGDTLFKQLSETAKRYHMAIIAPVSERIDGQLYNAAWVFDQQGAFVGRYCKVHCTATERARGIVPGNEWPVFNLGFGKMGVMICHDMSFPESARCLMLNGAEFICWPHNQSGWGDITWDAVLRTRAIDNCIYIVSSCCGTPFNRVWRPGQVVGNSGIIAPDGSLLADVGRGIGIATASIALNMPRKIYNFSAGGTEDYLSTMLHERRVDTYHILAETAVPNRHKTVQNEMEK